MPEPATILRGRLEQITRVIAILRTRAAKLRERDPLRRQLAEKLDWATRIERLLKAELGEGPQPTHVLTFKHGGVTIAAPDWRSAHAHA